MLSGAPKTIPRTFDDMLDADFAFATHLIARTPTIAASMRGAISINVDSTIDDAIERISDFDILVVPGGNPPVVMNLAQPDTPEMKFIKAFNALPRKVNGDERVILSICTGALMLAAAGILRGLKATTHHMALDDMRKIDGSIDVVDTTGERAVGRYVDSGRNRQGTRIVTAGGVTCGLDASLFVVELKAGRESSEFCATMAEHEWKRYSGRSLL